MKAVREAGRRRALSLLVGVTPALMAGCTTPDRMSSGGNGALDVLYFLGILVGSVLLAGLAILAAVRV